MMEELTRKNPWLGLESYKEGEVLYGRDGDIRDLTQNVLNDIDTLLYGKSGIGKSSILNAGVIPAARRHSYLPVLVRLSHKEKHPYLFQIRTAIEKAMIPIPVDEAGNEVELTIEEQWQRETALKLRIKKVLESRDNGKETFYEFFHRHTFHDVSGERIKLLIIFDQFEEIFTLQTDESQKKKFFAELADFLNDIMPSELQHHSDLAVDTAKETAEVISDGDFEDLFSDMNLGSKDDIPEYVNDNEIHLVFTIREDFLSEFEYYSASIPSLKQNRYGLRPINEEQAAEIILRPMPGLIDEPVAKLIIEKVTGRTDFELDGIPEIEVDSAVLSLYLNRLYDAKTGDTISSELVEQKGGEIIADFYIDAISKISESTVEYLEDMLLNGNGRRDNITVFDAIHDGGATELELDILCNKKKILRQFNYAGDLRIEYVHDILCPVVKAHKDERLLIKQQEEERQRQEEDKQRILLEEKAKREQIEREAEEEKAKLKEETIRVRKRNRRRLYVIGSFLVLLGLGATFYWFWNEKEYKASYATFTTIDGWPVGIGKELNDNDKRQMPVYYQLVRKGYSSHNTRVNVLNSHKDKARNKFSESPLVSLYETDGEDEKAKEFAILQRQTAYWIYTPDNDGNILRKTAYDPDGKELYAVQYFRSSAFTGSNDSELTLKKQLWANYVDKDGKSMRIRDNGADRVRIMNDSTGYIVGYQFFSETGTPQPNNLGAYGYRYKLGKDGRYLKKIPVDAFGDLLNDMIITYEKFDEYGRWTEIEGGKAFYSRDLVIFSMTNRTDSLKFGDQGELSYRSESHNDGHRRVFQYEKGQVLSTDIYRPTNLGIVLAYSKVILPKREQNVIETQVYWADSTTKYRIKRETFKKGQKEIAYYKGDSPDSIEEPLSIISKEGQYHKIVSDTIEKGGLIEVSTKYLDESGLLTNMCQFNRDVAYYNNDYEMIKHYVYKGETLLYAYLNEYEDGQIVAQSVIGVDGTPIRYAKWDKYHMCYYKMRLIYNFSNTLVAVKGLNEFGEESLVTIGDDEYIVNTVPSVEMQQTVNEADVYGVQVYKIQYLSVDKGKKVEYIHIMDKNGSWYKAGIRDGDLLVSEGNPVIIARPDKNTYDIKSIFVQGETSGAEHYSVYFTDKEFRRYNNALNTK